MRADTVDDSSGRPVLRLWGEPGDAALLRDASDRLVAAVQDVVEIVETGSATRLLLELGDARVSQARNGDWVISGTRDQWETRARLLDALAEGSQPGFQHLDYDISLPVPVVVTTYRDGTFQGLDHGARVVSGGV